MICENAGVMLESDDIANQETRCERSLVNAVQTYFISDGQLHRHNLLISCFTFAKVLSECASTHFQQGREKKKRIVRSDEMKLARNI